MSLPSFANQSIGVKRAPLVTDHGSEVRDWASAATRTQTGCLVQPAPGTEDPINRDAITTRWSVLAPVADILDTDRIVYGGVDHDIDGPVLRLTAGVLDHLEFTIVTVAG